MQIMKVPALPELTFLERRGRHSTREIGKMYSSPDGESILEENKARRQDRDHGEIATLSMVRGGLTEVTRELNPKEESCGPLGKREQPVQRP